LPPTSTAGQLPRRAPVFTRPVLRVICRPNALPAFFVAEPGGSAYRVQKGLRDMLIFSEQNVLKDPPFSRLDLISCRNLMIYFGAALQKRLLPLFHYSLNPQGMLFLGSSEGIGDFGDLFCSTRSQSQTLSTQREYSWHSASTDEPLPATTKRG
jgi:two-component system CheB/CheR fusion protein